MNNRERHGLDNHITGHYGKDQFERNTGFWPNWGEELGEEISAHQEYWEQRHNYLIYEYDPTDDGPEVGVISNILATHTWDDFYVEAYLREE